MKEIHTTFKLTCDALKEQIIASVDDQYINVLEANIIGYTNVTPLQLLEHLWKNYGKTQENDLSANETMMKTAWHPPTPIEELYKQLRNRQKFAKRGNEEISDSQLIRYAYDNVFNT